VASKVLEKLIYVVRVTFVVGNNCLFFWPDCVNQPLHAPLYSLFDG
jgi:hypothetical protein